MQLVIAYDGSKGSESALDDLGSAGLPKEGRATVVSVAEVWIPPADSVDGAGVEHGPVSIQKLVDHHRKLGEKALSEAAILASHATTRVQTALPDWEVTSEAGYGSPAWSTIELAEKLKADLIVVGAHGRSLIERLALGSVSQKVLAEAGCSVRVARGKVEVDAAPQRVMIGFDGSKGASAAVAAVAARNWPAGTEIRLAAASESTLSASIGRFVGNVTPTEDDGHQVAKDWLEHAAAAAVEKFQVPGLNPVLQISPGNPKHVLVEEARKWGADSIFMGATGSGSRFGSLLLGSTAGAVAARAHCSVEVVR
jgi:nucleotide-binding universal stress UspA family protein